MITPIEIRQQTFKKSLRGYDKEEVDAFLLALSQEWEQQLEYQRRLKEELDQIKTKYNTLKEVEDMLHKTLMQAERSSRDTIENASQKAELRIREAEARAQEIVRKGVEDRNGIQKEIGELNRYRNKLLAQLRGFLRTQIDHLETFDFVELPEGEGNPPQASLPKRPNAEQNLFGNAFNGNTDRGLFDDIVDEL